MRLERYILNEDTTENIWEDNIVNETIDVLKNDCDPYIKEIKKLGGPFLRATRNRGADINPILFTKFTRNNRNPLGTNEDVYQLVNKVLKSLGHLPRDKNVAMAISKFSELSGFGNGYMIFPIGPLNYSWVEANDFNYVDPNYWMSEKYKGCEYDFWHDDIPYDNDEYNGALIRRNAKKYIHTNKGLKEAYDKGYETWFKCKKYYLLDFKKDESSAYQVVSEIIGKEYKGPKR